jgi:hypothetical protein
MVAVTPTNLQKIEFDITTAEGPSRVTIVSGALPVAGGAFSSSINVETQNFSVSALVDPTLTPGQFRKATAIAALAAIAGSSGALPSQRQCSINNVEATLDGQNGRIEIRVDGQVAVSNGDMSVQSLTFQVTTLAKL